MSLNKLKQILQNHPDVAEQTTSRFPFHWCGMQPTVSGISQLDEPLGPHRAQEEALDASEPRDANPWGYADPIQSTYVRTGGNKMMTRLAHVRREGRASKNFPNVMNQEAWSSPVKYVPYCDRNGKKSVQLLAGPAGL